MSDSATGATSDEALTGPAAAMPEVAARLSSFVAAHGGTGTAVCNHLGRRGVRIVVIAADGRFADAVVPDLQVAAATCSAAGLPVGEWDRELTNRVTVSAADRRRMAGSGR
jgi:hypothetical protein